MTPQFLSEKMSRRLSSLAPGFEGHYYYGKYEHSDQAEVFCTEEISTNNEESFYKVIEKICPAWQVEDVLRNWNKIMPVAQDGNSVVDSQMNMMRHQFANKIVSAFLYNPNTAYQKIEEYLWEILGHSRTEECTGAHCKCMQNDCANHHYNDHKK